MKKNHFFLCVLCFIFVACRNQDKNNIEIRQDKRDRVEDVNNLLNVLFFEEVLTSRFAYIKIAGDFLLVSDLRSSDKLIHLYYKKTYKYCGSTGDLGQGPGEIASIGPIAYDDINCLLYVLDYGSMNVYSFNIKKAISDADYLPEIKCKIDKNSYPIDFAYVNDTLCYGAFSIPKGNDVQDISGKWNMLTGDVIIHKQEYPGLKVERVVSDYSLKNKLIVECSTRYDLMSIFNEDLSLKHRIYGPNWNKNGDYKSHFKSVVFYKDYIIASYDGTKYEEYNKPKVCHVFDLDGNYIKTLDVGYRIWRMSVDEDNDRLFFTFDDEIQFGYLDLKGILN